MQQKLQRILQFGKAAGKEAVGVELLAQIAGENHGAVIGGHAVVVVQVGDNVQNMLHILLQCADFGHDVFKYLLHRSIKVLVGTGGCVGCTGPMEDLPLVIVVQVKGAGGILIGAHQFLGTVA